MHSTLILLPLLASLVSASPITKRYTGAKISAGRDGKCLSASGTPYNGLAVLSVDCAGASTWDINPGSGSVILSGTNFALDAGSNPGNNQGLKVYSVLGSFTTVLSVLVLMAMTGLAIIPRTLPTDVSVSLINSGVVTDEPQLVPHW